MGSREALALIKRLMEEESKGEIAADDPVRLQVRLVDVEVGGLIKLASEARHEGATVQLEVAVDTGLLVYEAEDDGWSAQEPPAGLPRSFGALKERYTDEEVTDNVEMATIVVTFDKAAWNAPWIFWSVATFSEWIEHAGSMAAAEKLLSSGPARVALYEWKDPEVGLGPYITLGGLETAAPPGAPFKWPKSQPEWLQMAALTSGARCDSELGKRVNHISLSASLHLFAEELSREADGSTVVVLQRQAGRNYVLERNGITEDAEAEPLRELVRWVHDEALLTRLVVARRVFAEHWIWRDRSLEPTSLVNEAESAYHAAVDERIATALSAQAAFENHVADFSRRMADVSERLNKVTDEVVTRTIAAMLTIFVASVVAKDIRGWPALVASIAVGLYVGWVAWVVLGNMKANVQKHRDVLADGVSGRPTRLRDSARKTAAVYATSAENWIRFRQVFLGLLMAGTLGAGIALFLFIDEEMTSAESNPDSAQISATATPDEPP